MQTYPALYLVYAKKEVIFVLKPISWCWVAAGTLQSGHHSLQVKENVTIGLQQP